MKGTLEVADIFRRYGVAYRDAHKLPLRHLRVMRAIEICRTKELGGHIWECDTCGVLDISYNSCRNRHCPKCQSLEKERWLEARKKDLLPVSYFHVVFTIPEQLRPIALRNQGVFYPILFKAVSETLKQLGRDPKHIGAQIGFIAALHTWSQTLIDHPHIHCIVTGGGLSPDGTRWISSKKNFFIPFKVLSRLFRGKFLSYFEEAYEEGTLNFPGTTSELKGKAAFTKLLSDLYSKSWVVDCEETFKSPKKVIDYLGRYINRVAISNDRIVNLEDDKVTFSYRDSADKKRIKYMVLDAFEFIRRFLFHVLPDKFVKVRHYGILSTRNKNTKLLKCKQLLGAPTGGKEEELSWQELVLKLTGVDPTLCPLCGKGKLILCQVLDPAEKKVPP
jgi:hypothetical protein